MTTQEATTTQEAMTIQQNDTSKKGKKKLHTGIHTTAVHLAFFFAIGVGKGERGA